MGGSVSRLGAALLTALLAAASSPPASAADIDYGGTACPFPAYFSPSEPWATRKERPPRRGAWFYTRADPPGVNFLVPMAPECRDWRPAPWTPQWYTYCARRWPSFDPTTGTIVTADGVRMCR